MFGSLRQVGVLVADAHLIDRAENLSVIGPSGTGKSHLLEALGNAAIAFAGTQRLLGRGRDRRRLLRQDSKVLPVGNPAR